MKRFLFVLAALCFFAPVSPAAAATADAPRITKEEARTHLGSRNVVIVDARTESTWKGSDRKIKGAVRVDKWDLQMWASPYPADTTFIVY